MVVPCQHRGLLGGLMLVSSEASVIDNGFLYRVPRLHKNKMVSIIQLAKRVSHLVLHQCGGTEFIQTWICTTRYSMNYARAMFHVVLEELEDSGKT